MQFLAKAQSSYPDYYSLGGAQGILAGLAAFCGGNVNLCGSQLTFRLLAAQVGPPALRPQETLNQLKGIALPSLAAAVTIPNPFGRPGGPGHQSVVQNLVKQLESQGYKVTTEYGVKIPEGGLKTMRFVDVAALDPVTSEPVAFYQVGRLTVGGFP